MSPSMRTTGYGTMVTGGVMQGVALLMVALVNQPFPIALILMAGGLVLFLAGAVLYDQRSDASHGDQRLPTHMDDFA